MQSERAHYRECCETSKANLQSSFPVIPPPGSILPANSTDTAIHYSFDMAQQVHTLLLHTYQCNSHYYTSLWEGRDFHL